MCDSYRCVRSHLETPMVVGVRAKYDCLILLMIVRERYKCLHLCLAASIPFISTNPSSNQSYETHQASAITTHYPDHHIPTHNQTINTMTASGMPVFPRPGPIPKSSFTEDVSYVISGVKKLATKTKEVLSNDKSTLSKSEKEALRRKGLAD